MPPCSSCDHAGVDHNWTIPPCSLALTKPPQRGQHICADVHPRRLRGSCRQCACLKYVPLTRARRPVNRLIGRLRKGR